MDTGNRIIHVVLLRGLWDASLTCAILMFSQGLFSGKLADNYGPRWPLLFGSVLHVFGLMMVSISKEYYQIFLAQSIASGIGTSFLFYPSEKISIPSIVIGRFSDSAQLLLRQGLGSRDTERSHSGLWSVDLVLAVSYFRSWSST